MDDFWVNFWLGILTAAITWGCALVVFIANKKRSYGFRVAFATASGLLGTMVSIFIICPFLV